MNKYAVKYKNNGIPSLAYVEADSFKTGNLKQTVFRNKEDKTVSIFYNVELIMKLN